MTSERRKQDIETIAALTPLQQGVLFHALERGHEDPYHYQRVFVLEGDLSVPRFEQAWQQAADRHQALRTDYIVGESDTPLQVIYKQRPVAIEQVDWRDQDAQRQRAALEAWLAVRRAEGFAFRRAADARLRLMRVSDAQWWLAWSFHHVQMDGWSVGIALSDVLRAYCGDALPPSSRPFSSYLQWLGQRDHAASLTHWRSVLDLADGRTPLPCAGIERRAARAGYAEQKLSCPPALSTALRDAARGAGVTLNTVVQSAWGWLLARHAGTDGALFGTTVSGRSGELPGIEQTVGLFINTLPLHVASPADMSVRDWWRAVQRTAVSNQQHEHTPLPDIQRLRDGGSLFDSIVVFENYPVDAALRQPIEGLSIRLLDLRQPTGGGDAVATHGRNNFPLSLIAVGEAQLHLTLAYRRDAFDDEAIAALLRQLEAGLQAMADDPSRPLGTVALPAADGDGVLRGEAAAPAPHVLDAWARHLAADGDAPAFQDDATVLTRAQADGLANGLANGLAHALRARGAGPERVVALCLDRSVAFAVGWLGVLKAGAICLPLDPAQPPERLRQLLHDAGAVAIVGAAAATDLPVLDPMSVAPRADSPMHEPPMHERPDQGAYLIYTSGSTGAPKGVVISHRAIAHYTAGVLARLGLPRNASMAMVSTPAADLGHTMLFGAICGGHLLHLIPARRATDPDRFAEYMARHRVGALKIVPAHLRGLLEAKDAANVLPAHALVLGGEATSADLAARLRALRPEMQLFNHYGPTETTVGVLTHQAEMAGIVASGPAVPTGSPLPGTQVYVLDRGLNPVPPGVSGELYVGGPQVARGYLRQPGVTASRFVPDPFASGGRMYRTGDRVRQDEAGRIHYIGRADDQVKIRGYRVDPGEVAHAVRAVEGVRDAAVLVRDGRLVAWCVLDDATPDAVRAALRDTLPDHMVPSHVVRVDRLPVTANGKLDRRALPDPDAAADAFVPPRTETEIALAQIWQDVLGVPQVSAGDNFFALGGDSILTLKIIARLKKGGRRLLPKQVFEHPVLADLAVAMDAMMDAAAATPAASVVSTLADRSQPLALSFTQQRLWFLWLLNPQGGTYNIPRAVRLRGRLDRKALQRTFDALVARHEALRTTFDAEGSAVWQRIRTPEPVKIGVTDLRAAPDTAPAHADAEALAPFDLRDGPLLRVRLLQLADDDHVLLVTLHHIVADGWSMGIVIDEFARLYSGFATGAPVALPPLVQQYADHAAWQRRPEQAVAIARQLDWWRGHLDGAPPVLALPTDKPRPAMPSHAADVVPIVFAPALVAQLREVAQASRTTLFGVLLAAFQTLLYRVSGETSPCVGVPIANRHRVETADVVGVFINTQVWRARLSPAMTYRELLAQVRETAAGAQAHQDLPFEQLVEALQPARDVSRNPLFQVMANHQRRDRQASRRIAGLTVEPVERLSRRTKMDLSLDTQEDESGALEGVLGYATDLFDAATVARWRDRYLDILAAMVNRPDGALGATDVVPSAAAPARPPARPSKSVAYVPPRTPTQRWLAGVWAGVLAVPRIGIHDDVFATGAHSLLCLQVLAQLRASPLGAGVALRDLMQYPTIAALSDVIDGRVGEKDGAVPLNRVVTGPPLFCVHASFGTVSDYAPLAQALDGQRTVYGLACPPVERLGDIEALASAHVEALRRAQPHGPYHLLGWSLGGALAARMASMLERSGEQVAFLGLVDSYVPRAAGHVGRSRGSIGELVDYLEQALPGLDRAALEVEANAAGAEDEAPARVERIVRAAFAQSGDASQAVVQSEVTCMLDTATRLRALVAAIPLATVRVAVDNWWTVDRADADIERMHALLPSCLAAQRIDATHLGIVRAPDWIAAVTARLAHGEVPA
ncbi:non-ribosomal peptide synthetase [Cupriavidus plantarum]|uniref:non-ribosomal peptide synthetase n=1 Tax=Cupriavidus plantarum TaxID=942865 RepID=UPI001B213AC3|nr:non-ribosomal peptide synthetase [Cupriavidus plantarum]CAG2144437.1 D-alanine--D-alanyl carrier protein ligase [Cupriavidus plantarum]SMR85896.1 amino acid adenylation domain-containing protein [Cupriavidus plantarum]